MTNDSSHDTVSLERRRILAAMLAGGAGLAAIGHEERILAKALADDEEPDTLSGASRTITNWAKLNDLKQKVPMSKIGGVEISRVILGTNMITGWAHARDLLYLSDLVKAYHTRDKVYATLQMAEACGINAMQSGPATGKELIAYREQTGGKMKFISDTGDHNDKTAAEDGIKKAIDAGASLIYVHGEATDRYFLRAKEKFDIIAMCVQRIRDEGYPAGIGAHRIESVKHCIDLGIVPDFWMKTCHHLGYWSAMPDKREHDNVFCRNPEETVEFMRERTEPWIAFKTLAAGAIHPRDGFRFAFESGADFICVGMYDFQIVDNVNICMDILGGGLQRKRPWRTENFTEHEA